MEHKESTPHRGQLIFGAFVILLGVALLLNNLVGFDVWAYFWPLIIIGLGVWLILRPRLADPDTVVTQIFLGDIEREGDWPVHNEEISAFIADVELNMTKATVPTGRTRLRFMAFVGEIELLVPEAVGVAVQSNAFVSSVKLSGHKEDRFLSPLKWQSDNFKTAERQVVIEASCFVTDITVRQV